MISAEGKRLAGTFGLTVNAQNGVFFGAVGGYSVAVVENTSQRKYYITFPARPSQGAPDQAPGDFLHGFAARAEGPGPGSRPRSIPCTSRCRCGGIKRWPGPFTRSFRPSPAT